MHRILYIVQYANGIKYSNEDEWNRGCEVITSSGLLVHYSSTVLVAFYFYLAKEKH